LKSLKVLALTALLASCASLPVVLTKTYEMNETALATVDDSEYILCYGTKDISNITGAALLHCTSPAAKLAHLTDDLHLQVSKKLNDAFEAQKRLGPVLATWTAGTAVPKDLLTTIDDANQVNSLVQALDPKVPDASSLFANLKTWINDLSTLRSKIGG
jgi:hypothetical protein